MKSITTPESQARELRSRARNLRRCARRYSMDYVNTANEMDWSTAEELRNEAKLLEETASRIINNSVLSKLGV